jgi:hypothetical protein
MKIYSSEVMEALTNLRVKVNFNEEFQEDFHKMTMNNWAQEQKKEPHKRRTFETVKMHTAQGLGFEKALLTLPYFGEVNSIVDNANDIPYADRMRDYKYLIGERCFGQQKTFNLKYNGLQWYITASQKSSLKRSSPFNEHILVGGYHELAPLFYDYRPAFLIDSKKFVDNYNEYASPAGSFKSDLFNWRKAIKDNICVKLIEE